MSNLALLGGRKVRSKPFPPHPILEKEERRAILETLKRGRLSAFLAVAGEWFYGGEKVKEFERDFCKYSRSKYAVAMNSATACLHAAVVAVGAGKGDEIVVPPYTFTSTATSAMMANATPVFADIDPETFCIDPEQIKRKNTYGLYRIYYL